MKDICLTFQKRNEHGSWEVLLHLNLTSPLSKGMPLIATPLATLMIGQMKLELLRVDRMRKGPYVLHIHGRQVAGRPRQRTPIPS